MSAPVLVMPNFEKRFEVVCDASCTCLGDVLLQNGHPIAFESRKLSFAKKNYTTSEQELLAVVLAMKVWRCYLEGVECAVVTDHCPNTFFQEMATLNRRHAGWSKDLSRYRFKWNYRPRRSNVADPLNRVSMSLAVLIHSKLGESLTQSFGRKQD
jgi:hypothetical protein